MTPCSIRRVVSARAIWLAITLLALSIWRAAVRSRSAVRALVWVAADRSSAVVLGNPASATPCSSRDRHSRSSATESR